MVIQVVNIVVWLRRSAFSKSLHILNYSIMVATIITQLPSSHCCDLHQPLVIHAQQISLIVSLGLFAHIAALTTLHAIIALFVGFGYELVVLYDSWAIDDNLEQLVASNGLKPLTCTCKTRKRSAAT